MQISHSHTTSSLQVCGARSQAVGAAGQVQGGCGGGGRAGGEGEEGYHDTAGNTGGWQ